MRFHLDCLKNPHGDDTDFTIILQRFLDTGIVPKDWKHAIITPTFKKGSKPSNYGPISLTCIATELIEHIIVSNMMDFSDTHKYMYFALSITETCQTKLSFQTQIIGLAQEIADSLDQDQQNCVTVMDCSKAFDKADHHKRGVHKLKKMELHQYITTWIKDVIYIKCHSMSQSKTRPLTGSLCFLVFTWLGRGRKPYLRQPTRKCQVHVHLFADDAIVINKITCI